MPEGIAPESVALRLLADQREGRPFHPAGEAREGGLAYAYAVQRELFHHAGFDRAGWKIALTTAPSQAFCKTDEPISGMLPREGLYAAPCTLDRADYARLGLEMELAVRIGKALPERIPEASGMAHYIDRLCAAFEVIDDRLADYGDLDAASLVADNCWNRAFVLGPLSECGDPASIDDAACRLDIEGARSAEGQVTADIHPFRMVGWLERHLRDRGLALKPGDWVMTGNLLGTQFPSAPSRYSFQIGDLPPVDIEVV